MTAELVLATGIAASLFAAIHLFIGRLHWMNTVPRNRGLSFAGGVAVAYVFLHILPEIAAHQREFAEEVGLSGLAVERWIYALALLGLALFYGVERRVRISRSENEKKTGEDVTGDAELWLHIAAFAMFNLLIGYLLVHREDPSTLSLATYTIAMALHFMTADFGMRAHHEDAYGRVGRWVIAAAVMLGWGLGLAITLPPVAVGGLFAFLAGGVILNVLKEELPEERRSRFGAFLFGVMAYGALLLLEATLA